MRIKPTWPLLPTFSIHILHILTTIPHQIDNYSEAALHPVLLHDLKGSEEEGKEGDDEHPIFQLIVVKEQGVSTNGAGDDSTSSHDGRLMNIYKYVVCRVLPVALQLDSASIQVRIILFIHFCWCCWWRMMSILTPPPLLYALSIHIFITFHLHLLLLPSLYRIGIIITAASVHRFTQWPQIRLSWADFSLSPPDAMDVRSQPLFDVFRTIWNSQCVW